MMRALNSGVAGLKAHQTSMDVIGNNIANVNTAGFKASSVTFSDVLYQTTQSASGPNASTGAAGQNAMQIGLGSMVSAITTNISESGGTNTTNNPFDVMINGDGFFVVNQGGTNYFTKDGSFKIDANGTLCTSSGAPVMGWQADETGTSIVKNTVSALNVMSSDNMYSEPDATTAAYVSGNIDTKDTQAADATVGTPVSFSYYDNKGDEYTATIRFYETDTAGQYTVALSSITDKDGNSIAAAGESVDVTFGSTTYKITTDKDGNTTVTGTSTDTVTFNTATGKFESAGGADNSVLTLKAVSTIAGMEDISVDFSGLTNYSNGGTSTATARKGDKNNLNAGRQVGEMSAISIDSSGIIIGTYSNGTSKYLGQLALATFSNPSGLESIGGNLFAETKNSGSFDGIGVDPTTGGSSLTTGALESSNVDLAQEFTNLITTQRGYQANSRIITTADTLLEELVNLKR